MIQGLYETHLEVSNLERSIQFYTEVLGLELCDYKEERRVAFFWIEHPKVSMLGIWEKPKDQVRLSHFAFRSTVDFILNESVDFFKQHGLKFRNFLNDGTERPMVFAWIPAIAIYFTDPDGHSLEFIAVLDGKGQPSGGILSYEEWLTRNAKDITLK